MIFNEIEFKLRPLIEEKYLVMEFPSQNQMSFENMPCGLIDDSAVNGFGFENRLLNFLKNVIEAESTETCFRSEGYEARVIAQKEKKMLKISFYLTDDYEPAYISPENLMLLLKLHIKEKQEFEESPHIYKEKLKKMHNTIVLPKPIEILDSLD